MPDGVHAGVLQRVPTPANAPPKARERKPQVVYIDVHVRPVFQLDVTFAVRVRRICALARGGLGSPHVIRVGDAEVEVEPSRGRQEHLTLPEVPMRFNDPSSHM